MDVDRLKAEFSARYSCFRDLLSANRKALESFTALEQLGQGGDISMASLRRHATASAVSVGRMINDLEALAPDRYPDLEPRFKEIRTRLGSVLQSELKRAGPLVMALENLDICDSPLAGPKMASLGMLASKLNLTVPKGFVITTAAYDLLLKHNQLGDEIARRLQLADIDDTGGLFETCSEIQALFLRAELPTTLADEVELNLERLAQASAEPLRLAMRSSAGGEDQAGASFAGQFSSELNVDPERWAESYLQVVASLYGPSALSYRLRAGLKDQEAAMAVGCLAMVKAAAGGVVYTAHPSDPNDGRIYVNSCWGLPKAVVDGTWDCDQFGLDPGPPLRLAEKMTVLKHKEYRCDPEEGVFPARLDQDRISAPSLDDDRILELAEMALLMDRSLGGPLDIEWALDRRGEFCILQCRALPRAGGKTQPEVEEPQGEALARGGITASPGRGFGRLRWVRTGGEALAFLQGEVLAVEQPLPRWAPLLGRAAAVISLRGGMAGHLASVAREFGLPALFGLGPAGAELGQGAEVTVDASARAVYRGGREAPRAADGSSAAPSTPLARTLSAVLELTAPLKLLDPEADGFTPRNCRTLHDLTRFCHQKAVEEMFSRAAGERFARNAAQRLFYKVPMQWWIIDLGGGIREGAGGKLVRLEDIVCEPFRAFWEGLIEIPWDGPPPPDAGGMASVMFQATMNPSLGSPVKGAMAERNYFLIDRKFMNLQSRIGFHFSTLEAALAQDSGESFVSFCFQGGAADLKRKIARLALLEELLMSLGMDCEIRGEALLARAEGRQDGECLSMVKALGYLTMHLRQLDMIMANSARTGQYRAKLQSDLAALKPPVWGEPALVQ